MGYAAQIIRMSLISRIHREAEGFSGVLGVAVKHLRTGESASLMGGELFPTASVFKLPVIVELYRQVDAGTLSLDEKMILREEDKVPGSGVLKELSPGLAVTLRDLVELMMILSDNTATDIVVEKVGMERVNEALRSLGLRRTKIVADCRDMLFDLIGLNDIPEDEKTMALYREKSKGVKLGGSWSLGTEHNDVTTPNEMLRLVEMIVEGRAASRSSCDAILETMSRCQTGTYRIAKYLPRESVEVADKTGALPGIRNDAGVVTLLESGERYVLSCFTKGASDNYAAEEVIARVSRGVYDHFTG